MSRAHISAGVAVVPEVFGVSSGGIALILEALGHSESKTAVSHAVQVRVAGTGPTAARRGW